MVAIYLSLFFFWRGQPYSSLLSFVRSLLPCYRSPSLCWQVELNSDVSSSPQLWTIVRRRIMAVNMSVSMLIAPMFAGAVKDLLLTQTKKRAQVSYSSVSNRGNCGQGAQSQSGTLDHDLGVWGLLTVFYQACLTCPKVTAHFASMPPSPKVSALGLGGRPRANVCFQHPVSMLPYFILTWPDCTFCPNRAWRIFSLKLCGLWATSLTSHKYQKTTALKRIGHAFFWVG